MEDSTLDKVLDWFWDKLIFVVVVGVIGGIALIAVAEINREDRFMRECQQDLKRYECEALWRSGQRKTVIMPMRMP